MGNRAKQIALGAASALALMAAPASAQLVDRSNSASTGTTVTDIQIADTPQTFLDDQVLAEALKKAADAQIVSGSAFNKGDVAGAARAAFGSSAANIIGNFNLDEVPGLEFTTAGNKIAAEQDGTRNLATINQERSRGGWAVVNQAGEDNSTAITQADTRAPGEASRNRAYVGQIGSATPSGSGLYSNTAEIVQTHSSFDPTRAVASGINDPNNATIQQGGTRDLNLRDVPVSATARSAQNRARIEQTGAGNDGVIQQGLETAALYAFELGDQVGRNNRAIMTQVGIGNRAVILQEDDANAITRQYGSDNEAFVSQNGDVLDGGQYSLIEQGAPELPDVNSNVAVVFQRGILQESLVRQLSSRNQAFVNQTAESGYAKSAIEQRGGTDNFASVFQSAPSSTVDQGVYSAIVQNGNSNEAWVSQRVASSASAISQTGDRNFASVRQ
ncbi:hypothetical protein [Novosphingobium sp. JCM 18896]|uniref:hypothetical protein n=1 Tax=Novosphingobium sp. JCM 18896 TaxID=2989731 RepID=UPI002222CEA4|nr:hypothetical protein [Novosphingobium sp. JCM 18896]MCW1431499.1 hypothetical protein [Novosphingobium sp. JCM 18896]